MKLTSVLRWIGIVIISLWCGMLVGLFSKEFIELAFESQPRVPTIAYSDHESLVQILAPICFLWSAVVSFILFGFGGRIRFHLLYLSGVLLLSFCLYLVIEEHSMMMIYNSKSPTGEVDIAAFLAAMVVFMLLITFSELLLLASLLIDKGEQEQQRAIRRQKRL